MFCPEACSCLEFDVFQLHTPGGGGYGEPNSSDEGAFVEHGDTNISSIKPSKFIERGSVFEYRQAQESAAYHHARTIDDFAPEEARLRVRHLESWHKLDRLTAKIKRFPRRRSSREAYRTSFVWTCFRNLIINKNEKKKIVLDDKLFCAICLENAKSAQDENDAFLQSELSSILKADPKDTTAIKTMKASMLKNFNHRFPITEIEVLASLLDPRFQNLTDVCNYYYSFCTRIQKTEIKNPFVDSLSASSEPDFDDEIANVCNYFFKLKFLEDTTIPPLCEMNCIGVVTNKLSGNK
ncbi:hypothetical protein ILUMI_27260 [Ignelater luminosus]|uniref:Uncharacterized protein n=1 Tax=Ignelater luminosus TaxID=2038154 RepID=A0A8K0C391_IGNLU|nr:hypothetical protein ILUMI_27260 [Ignelater luminosus]